MGNNRLSWSVYVVSISFPLTTGFGNSWCVVSMCCEHRVLELIEVGWVLRLIEVGWVLGLIEVGWVLGLIEVGWVLELIEVGWVLELIEVG